MTVVSDYLAAVNAPKIAMIAAFSLLTAILAYMTRADVKTMEINTNSKMDALLEETRRIAFAAGEAEERRK